MGTTNPMQPMTAGAAALPRSTYMSYILIGINDIATITEQRDHTTTKRRHGPTHIRNMFLGDTQPSHIFRASGIHNKVGCLGTLQQSLLRDNLYIHLIPSCRKRYTSCFGCRFNRISHTVSQALIF